MKHMPEHLWRSVEKGGRERFVWKHRVLPFGVPMTLLMIIWGLLQIHVGWKDLLQGKGVGFIYLATLIGLGIAYGAARLEWEDHKKKYDSAKPSVDKD